MNKLFFSKFRGLLFLGILGAFASSTQAAPVNEIDYFSITVGEIIDFEGIGGGGAPGTNYDGLLDLGGATFGERFNGQTLSISGNSDVVSGLPAGGSLSLIAGAANANLNIFNRGGVDGNVLTGLGFLGFPDFNAIGEGAVAILFDNDQSQFGFQSVGGNLGAAFFSFFSRDGSLIDTISPTGLGTDFFGFSREGGIKDIAGISIYNTDPAGIGFNDVIFDVPGTVSVANPGILWLFASAIFGFGVVSRRKK